MPGKQAHEDARFRPREPLDNNRPSQKGNGMGGSARHACKAPIDRYARFIRGLAIIAEMSGPLRARHGKVWI